MKEVSRTKRLEVAHYYLLGYSYREIEEKTGVSHGSVVNIVREIESGELVTPGTPFDQVNDLRRLSSDLRKKGIQPSEALLGLIFFERLRASEVSPEYLDRWSELIKVFAPADFPAKDFFEAALRLRELEDSQGRPFESLTEEYMRLQEGIANLRREVDSLGRNKAELSREVEPLSSQLESLRKRKEKLENDVETQAVRVQELGSKVKQAEEERSRLSREVKDLERRKVKLSSEVDGKEESLRRLNDIGLSDADLMRAVAFLEKMSKGEGTSTDQVKEQFFAALSLFKDISGLEKRREMETKKTRALVRERSVLDGEILKLERRKGILEAEIDSSVSSTTQKICDIGEEAASQIQQQVADIEKQFGGLFEDALKVGQAVGKMQRMVKKGEESGKSLTSFLKEARSRLGRN